MHDRNAADPAGGKCQRIEQQACQKQRPGGGGSALGHLAVVDEEREEADQQRQRQVDEARPVHQRAGRDPQPVLHEIEPALAIEEIAHLDETHGIVIVGADQILGAGQIEHEAKMIAASQ